MLFFVSFCIAPLHCLARSASKFTPNVVLMIVLPGWINTISLSTRKKRKLYSENRQFNSEWTQKYLFGFATGKLVCLLCSECISVCKELRRHFKINHANFDTTFPLGSDARRQKILGLTWCYEQRRRTLTLLSFPELMRLLNTNRQPSVSPSTVLLRRPPYQQ